MLGRLADLKLKIKTFKRYKVRKNNPSYTVFTDGGVLGTFWKSSAEKDKPWNVLLNINDGISKELEQYKTFLEAYSRIINFHDNPSDSEQSERPKLRVVK